MTTVALSTEGLARLHNVMSGHVEAGEMPGLVTLVALTACESRLWRPCDSHDPRLTRVAN